MPADLNFTVADPIGPQGQAELRPRRRVTSARCSTAKRESRGEPGLERLPTIRRASSPTAR
jgi:hypothetical protein